MKEEVNLTKIKELIKDADAILITAGAGIGVDMVPFITIEMDNIKTPYLLAS